MEKSKFFFVAILFLASCGNDKPTDAMNEQDKKEDSEVGSVDSRAASHVERTLSIPGNEKYSLKIYKEHLNGDDKIDAIVTVNRLEHAMDEAAKSDKTAKSAEIGFMGQYNYFYFFDGKNGQFSIPMLIASSPLSELKVSFENITSDAYKDVLFDFKILDGSFKDFYTITNMTPTRIFQWKNYVGLNTSETEAYHFKYETGTMGPRKDILVMKGELVQPIKKVDPYTFDPTIQKKNELMLRFFYHPATGKYMTKNN